jgi:SMI1 / KNR4 family (SUKH-1)
VIDENASSDANASEWRPNRPARAQELLKLVTSVGKLPEDYLDFLGSSNGGVGFLGSNYVILWEASDLLRQNDAYEVAVYAPGFFIFGSDGGGEAFGFDTRGAKYSVMRLPFVGMDWEDAVFISDSFSGLLRVLQEE